MANDTYLTQIIQFGIAGLDLKRSLDLVPATKLTRMTNVDRTEEGRLTLRKGQLIIANAASSVLVPKTDPRLQVDQPTEGIDITIPFLTRGWAVDLAAVDGAGIDFVHIWAFPTVEESFDSTASFLGQFPISFDRPGVAALFGDQFLTSGWQASLVGNVGVGLADLATGPYVIRVFAHSSVTDTFVISRASNVEITAISVTTALEVAKVKESLESEGAQPPVVPVVPPTTLAFRSTDERVDPDERLPDLTVASGLKAMDVPGLTSWNPLSGATTTVDDLLRLGVENVRLPFIESSNGSIDFILYDALTVLLDARELGIIGVVGPDTLGGDSSTWTTDGYRRAFARRLRGLTARYPGITFWEIWPEPDAELTRLEPDDYAKLLTASVPALTGATIVLGSIGPAGLQAGENYLSDLYASAEAQSYRSANGTFSWDRVSITPSIADPDEELDEPVDRARAAMVANGDGLMKMWLLLGWDSRLISELSQADFLARAYTKINTLTDSAFPGLALVFERFVWKRYQDTETEFFGVLDENGRQKPAYESYFRLGSAKAQRESPDIQPDPGGGATPAKGPEVHSLFRLNDPRTGKFCRLAGVGSTLFHGVTGKLAAVDSGYPEAGTLDFAAMDPILGGAPWVYIASRRRMRKIRVDGLSLPIGLPAPDTQARTSFGAEERTTIDNFDSDGPWTSAANVGPFDITGSSRVVDGIVGNAVEFQVPNPDSPPDPFPENNFAFWSRKLRLDLDKVGSRDASDSDLIHVHIRVDLPERLIDVKLYFVVNADFINGRFGLPGATGASFLAANTDAYMKSFRRHDFEGVVSMFQSPQEATAETAASETDEEIIARIGARLDRLGEEEGRETDPGALIRQAHRDKSRGVGAELAPGRFGWSEFGVIDMPLRRGDFLRIGSDADRDWRHVTGIFIAANVKSGEPGAGAQSLQVTFDDLYLTGGYEIDNADFGADHYDWRYTNYDPRTGAESNPSPTMAKDTRVDTPRRKVFVKPQPFGDPAIRQRFYRRGGTIVENWFFEGVNNGDGARFADILGDAEIAASSTLDLDNDQPVTTLGLGGSTKRNAPLSSIWGPIQDMLLGCGDVNRPGHLYWAKPGEPDHWPPQNNVKVTSTSEELMAGFVYGSDTYVFSRLRLYQLYPVLAGETGTVHYQPTDCNHGLVNNRAFVVGYQGIFFASDDGIYQTRGGAEVNLSDESIEQLFRGESRNGLPVVRPATIRLELHENELWFIYSGPGEGAKAHVLLYDLVFRYWRHYDFLDGPMVALSERSLLSAPNVMMLGTRGGLVQKLVGTLDNAVAIEAHLRTGALDQGAPRRDKVYGDIAIDVSHVGGGRLTIQGLVNDEATELKPITIQPSTSKDRTVINALKAVRARNLALDLKWTNASVSVYFGTLQYLIDDGIERIRWDTEEIDHGVPGWSVPLYAHISLRAEAAVTLNVHNYDQSGAVTTKTYTIPGSSGLKVRRFVPFEAVKGILFKYVFTSSETFKIYREESIVAVRAWGAAETFVQPFGDALSVSSAEIASVRGVGR